MKILKIYIENFGCLHKYTKEFTNGINVIEEDNGFGKTTLANFIKAMFYGFTNSKKSIEDNDRLKYAPWQGGQYGGQLVFEYEGKIYRIERFFNPVGSTKDTFKLYDVKTNKESKDFSKNIGEEIFNVDVDGYIRSSYIPQSEVKWSDNKKLAQNLTNMLEDSGSEDITEAIKKLETESKKYVKTGGRGLIGETEALILSYEEKLETADISKETNKSLEKKLETITSNLEECIQKLQEVKAEIKVANKQSQKDAIYNHYKSLIDNKEALQKELQKLDLFFNGNYPTKEQISHNYDLLEEISILQIEIKKLTTNDYINEEYTKLRNYFDIDNNPISEEVIKEKIKENDELKKLSIERENISVQIDKVDDKLANETVLTPTHKTINIILGFLSIVLMIPGIVMLVDTILAFTLVKLFLTICLVLFGIGFGVVALIIIIIRANSKNNKLAKNKKLEEDCETEKIQLVKTYKELDEKFNTLSRKIKDFVSKYESVDNSFITRLKEDDDYLIQLNNISNNYKTYIKLEQENKRRFEKSSSINEKYNNIKNELDSFTKCYISESESFQALKTIQLNFDRYELVVNRLNNAQKELEVFLKENEVDTNHEEHVYNIRDLENEETKLEKMINNLQTEKINTENSIKNNEMIIDSIFELQMQIDQQKELLVEYKEKYNIIQKTIKYLTEAQEKLSSNYLVQMQDSFNKYINYIIKTDESFTLSSDLEISTEKYGSQKEVGFYSTGYKDIIFFCARIAFLESVFKDVNPTIILDDPFTNYDEEKLSLALKLLEELSNKYQIIYLICHSSRNIKK